MKNKKVLLISNSHAGTGSVRNKLYTIISNLALENVEVTVYPVIPKKGLVSEKVINENAKNYDCIVCCGGDGTLNHVINAMIKNKIKKPIGYIPTGSANDFSKNLDTSLEIDDICKAIADGDTFAYDIGKINNDYFNYVAAFGAFTNVSYATDQDAKNTLGFGAYILQSIATLPEALSFSEHIVIEHDGKVEEGDFILGTVSNSVSIAGIQSKFISRAKLNDGLFEVMLIHTPKNLGEFNDILGTLASGNTNNKYVKVFTTNKVVFKSNNDIAWTIDGEEGNTSKKTTIKVLPKAMKIMIDKKEKEC